MHCHLKDVINPILEISEALFGLVHVEFLALHKEYDPIAPQLPWRRKHNGAGLSDHLRVLPLLHLSLDFRPSVLHELGGEAFLKRENRVDGGHQNVGLFLKNIALAKLNLDRVPDHDADGVRLPQRTLIVHQLKPLFRLVKLVDDLLQLLTDLPRILHVVGVLDHTLLVLDEFSDPHSRIFCPLVFWFRVDVGHVLYTRWWWLLLKLEGLRLP